HCRPRSISAGYGERSAGGSRGHRQELVPELIRGDQMSDFTGLAIAGRVATASDPDWDEARLAWNLAADQRPEAVAFAESGDDIAKTIRFAAENGQVPG